jgi:parallel beta-helix repeat protein
MRLRPTFLALILLVTASSTSFAANWFVAAGGRDSNPGTIGRPFGSITKASSVARPGDVVNVRGGVYRQVVRINARGREGGRITFRPYPGEKVIIDGSGSPAATNLVQLNRTSFVDFTGFEVRNATGIGIAGWGATDTRVSQNDVHHSMKRGIWFGYSAIGTSARITIDSNRVHENVLENRRHTANGGWSQAITVERTDGALVTRNRVYRNHGEGIVVLLSDNVVVRSNVLYDNYSVQLYLDNAQSTTVERNFLDSTGDSRFYRDGFPAHGIGMANEEYAERNPLRHLTIVNNIVVRSRRGIFYGDYERGGGLRNVLIAHNTVVDATHEVLSIDRASHRESVVENNIFVGGRARSLASVRGGGITYRSNLWSGGAAGTASGRGDVQGNPSLINAAGRSPADFRITRSSPAAGRARSSKISTDFFGTARVAPNDIGAHQLNAPRK